jgi:hypothetical protein
MSFFERLPWCERIFSDGWDEGIREAVMSVDRLPETHGGPAVPRADVERLAARLRAELEDASSTTSRTDALGRGKVRSQLDGRLRTQRGPGSFGEEDPGPLSAAPDGLAAARPLTAMLESSRLQIHVGSLQPDLRLQWSWSTPVPTIGPATALWRWRVVAAWAQPNHRPLIRPGNPRCGCIARRRSEKRRAGGSG